MKTAIVILNWNGKKFLEQFLPSLIDSLIPDSEIWVADNASTDDSLEFLANKFPSIKLLRLDKNWGFAGGYNKAFEKIDAEYYILLNSDIEVSKNWLTPLVEFMDKNPTYHACQPKILSYYEKDKFEYAGASGGFIDEGGFPFCRGRIFNKLEVDNGQYNDIVDIFWASGASLMIRSDIYKKLGGLDDSFFAHMEEVDLCWRIWNAGGKIAVVPESTIFHIGGGTLPRQSSKKTYLNFRNNHLLIYKNYPYNKLNKVFRKRFFLDMIAAAKFFMGGNFGDFKAVFKGRKDARKMRKNTPKSTATDFPPAVYRGNIVADHYFKGKKLFSELNKEKFV